MGKGARPNAWMKQLDGDEWIDGRYWVKNVHGDCKVCENRGVKKVGCAACSRKRMYFPAGTTTSERFWGRVDKGEGCWRWRGASRFGEYGHMTIKGKLWRTHRLAWKLTHGTLALDMMVCHRCDNKWCVRPDHLFIGSQKENIHDLIRRHGYRTAKLSIAQVKEIREAVKTGSKYKELAKVYRVSPGTIKRVADRTTFGLVS